MKRYPMLEEEPCEEEIQVGGGIAISILNLGTKWKWVISFTPRSF
jgi:hypothetical protein